MGERVESFLTYLLDERGLSSNTLSAYRNDLSQFSAYLDDSIARSDSASAGLDEALASASRDQIVSFFLFLRERGYAPATIARKMAALKSLFLYFHRHGVCLVNPAASLDSPTVKKPVPRAISPSDIDLLLRQAGRVRSAEGLRDSAMLRLLCATGMRVTELVSLNLDDTDFERAFVICTGRNSRRRELPLDGDAVEALALYLREGWPQLARAGDDVRALFLNHRGRRLTRQGFWLIMKLMVRESGLTVEVTPHTLRHSFAAHRLRTGTELHQLRDLLGHANISTTQMYTQVQVETSLLPHAHGASPAVLGNS